MSDSTRMEIRYGGRAAHWDGTFTVGQAEPPPAAGLSPLSGSDTEEGMGERIWS